LDGSKKVRTVTQTLRVAAGALAIAAVFGLGYYMGNGRAKTESHVETAGGATIPPNSGKLDLITSGDRPQLSPATADDWNNGNKRLREVDYAGAEASFARAAQIQPRSADILAALSAAQLYQGKLDESHSTAEEATSIDPRNIGAGLSLAGALAAKGDDRAAIKVFDGLLAANPNQPEAVWGAAQCASRTGNIDQARRHFEHYLLVQNSVKNAEYARQWLEANDATSK
jgi:tetratricopeptide (TPR) repeat protein